MNTLSLSRREFLLRTAATAAIASGVSCAASPSKKVPFHPDRVFLITIDTLRRDHLPWHSYPRNTMPFLNELVRSSVYFKEAICACSNTTPSHTSIFSGLHIAQHGMFHNAYEKLNPGLYLLSDYFADAGYDTSGFASVVWMKQFIQGFETFDTYTEEYVQKNSEARNYRNAQGTIDTAIAWLQKQTPAKRFLNFIHVYDPHILTTLPPQNILDGIAAESKGRKEEMFRYWTETQHKRLETLPYQGDKERFTQAHNIYDAQITFVDQQIKRYYEEAKKLGLLENSLWIVTTDHGEGLGGHMYNGHGKHIYQEQISCPLIFHTPGEELSAQEVPHRVHHVDIFPTIQEMLGLPLPESRFTRLGKSFWGEIAGNGKSYQPSVHFCQRRYKLDYGFSKDWEADPIYTLLEGDYSYIVNESGKDEMYNVKDDPYQTQNLIAQNLPEGMELRKKAQEFYALLETEGGHKNAPINKNETSTPFEKDLSALGYL